MSPDTVAYDRRYQVTQLVLTANIPLDGDRPPDADIVISLLRSAQAVHLRTNQAPANAATRPRRAGSGFGGGIACR
jgi:hypothetical protein